MPPSLNRLERSDVRKLEDLCLAHKASIEDGTCSVQDLIDLFKKLHNCGATRYNIDAALGVLSINRPKQHRGTLTPVLQMLRDLEARVAALEEATTRPFPKAQPLPHPQR